MSRSAFIICFALALAAALPASGSAATKSPEPTLKSVYSGLHRLEEFKTEKTKAIVLAFLDAECPIAQKIIPSLTNIHGKLSEQGVVVLGIYSNARVNVFSMALHSQEAEIPFVVLQDVEQRLADRFGVETTPEVVVLDANLERQYRGPIDNQFKRGGNLKSPTENYLEDALTAVLAGKSPVAAEIPAEGCPLSRRAPPVPKQEITYHRDVAPILQKNCQTCHRDGGVGPFTLGSYEDAYYNADRIAEAVRDRRMPPWHGVLNPEFGELENDKRLSSEEVSVLLGWVAQETPEGNRKDAPPAAKFPGSNDWEIGKPDYVFKMPEPFQVPKNGVLEYQFFRVPLNHPEDRWYRAVEVKPGVARVVHHVAIHVVPASDKKYQGLTAMAELYGFNAQRANVIADFVPGDTHNATTFPVGQAGRIPKHSDLIYEVHYTPDGRAAAADQSVVGFQWADKPLEQEVHGKVFRKPVGRFRIPPHHSHFRMEDSYYFKTDVDLDAIRPHFHLRGKSYRLELVERNEDTGEIQKRTTVLSIPLFDQRWQRTYELKKPIRIPAGAELLATAHFDNSRLNPNNPDPTAEVLWGQQTSDEMFSTRLRFRLVGKQAEADGR